MTKSKYGMLTPDELQSKDQEHLNKEPNLYPYGKVIMGNPEDRLEEAINNNKPQEVENIIEQHPEEAKEVIPNDSPLEKEAEQVTDGDERTSEVRNDVVEKETERLSENFKDTNELNSYLNQYYKDLFDEDEELPKPAQPIQDTSEIDAYYKELMGDEEPGSDLIKPNTGMLGDPNPAEQGVEGGESSIETSDTQPLNEQLVNDEWETFLNAVENGEAPNIEKKLNEMVDKIEGDPETKNKVKNAIVAQFTINDYNMADSMRELADYIERNMADMPDDEYGAICARAINMLGYDLKDDDTKTTWQEENFNDDPDKLVARLRWKSNWVSNKPAKASFASDLQPLFEQGLITEDDLQNAMDVAVKTLDKLKAKAKIAEDVQKEADWIARKVVTHSVKNSAESKGIDWDKVKIYKPGEDPYHKVSDESDWINNPDYEPSESEGGYLNKDEDFAGPDELPATIDQIRDEDFVGPDEQLDVYRGGLPSEYVKVDDPYNHEWSWEVISSEVDNDDTIPPEEKESTKARRWKLAQRIEVAGHPQHATSSNIKADIPTNKGFTVGTGPRAGLPRGGMSSIGGVHASSAPISNKPISNKSISNGRMGSVGVPIQAERNSVVSAPSYSNGQVTSNGGGVNSGATKANGGSLIVKPYSLPNGEANNQADLFAGGASNGGSSNGGGLRDSYIARLDQRIKSIPEGLAEELGFSIKYKHVEYNQTPLEDCSGGQLQEIESILIDLGV